MDICIIGTAGHANYVLEGVRLDKDIRITGIAPGAEQENIKDLEAKISKLGQKPAVFTNFKEMLIKLKPDVVAIASQFYKQAFLTIEALKLGINVFVEKPLATKLEDLAVIKRVYENSNVSLAAMFGIRYKPWFMTAWKYVQQGVIGRVRLMNAQKSYKLGSRADFYKRRETYGGTIPWVGSHAIDWLYWFSGESFETVYAAHSRRCNREHGDLELTAQIHFNLTNEVLGGVNIDYLRPETALTHGDDRIRVVGTSGVIEVRNERVFLINNEQKGIQEIGLEENRGIFVDFLKQLRGEGKCLISAEDSFYITEVCLKARQSADENRVITFENS